MHFFAASLIFSTLTSEKPLILRRTLDIVLFTICIALSTALYQLVCSRKDHTPVV